MAKQPSMDSLKIPEDMDKQAPLDNQKVGKSLGSNSGLLSNTTNLLASTDFDRASKSYAGIEKVKEKEKAEKDDFIPKEKPDLPKAPEPKKVKIGKKHFTLKKVVAVAVTLVVLVAISAFFFPPIMTNEIDKTSCDSTTNIFATSGITDLKIEYATEYSIYNEEMLKSEKAENYREVFFTFNMHNYSIFQVEIPQYEVLSVSSSSKNHVIYAGTASNKLDDIIQPFSSQEVTIKVLINVENLSDDQFQGIIQGLAFKTVGMKKKIGASTYCPCIPAVVFVDNDVKCSMNN